MTDILLVPLDNRPCTSRFPVELAAITGFKAALPPAQILGNVQKPARLDQLQSWLENQLDTAQVLVLSLDTWLYGGLVFSRKSTESLQNLQARLTDLKKLKARFPSLRISAFATLLRLSNHNDATEERPYWADYGTDIHRYAWLEDYLSKHPEPSLEQEYQALKTHLPTAVLTDYRALRQRNFTLLLEALQYAQDGIFENLYIGCDDSGEYGWNIQEKTELSSQIQARGLEKKVLIYPGADEIASVLFMRTLVPERLKVAVNYSFPETCEMATLYEGVPLSETLQAQAQAAGIEWVSAEQAQAQLWIHNPPQRQTDQYLDRAFRQPITPAEYARIVQALETQNLPSALADICYANGGDQQLLEQLEEKQALHRLSVYSAWNTTGNTLGFALAWLKACLHQQDRKLQLRFLLERLLDDGWYQGIMRQRLCAHYSEPVTLDSCLRFLSFGNERLKQ